MPLDVAAVVAQLDPLIELIEERAERDDPLYGEYMRGSESDAREALTRGLAMIRRLAPAGSVYADAAARIFEREENADIAVVRLAGVLRGLRTDYEQGDLQSVEELVHAEVFSDFLQMADELSDKRYKDPAAVVAGSVLEDHLRKLAGRHGVDVEGPDGRPRKADTLNADLKKADAYSGLEQKSVTAWLDLRNKAAHGRYDEYDHGQVEALIRDVRAFIMRHPA